MKTPVLLSSAFKSQQGFIIASFVAIFAAILVFFMIPRKYIVSTPGKGAQTIQNPYCRELVDDPNAAIVSAPNYTRSEVLLGTTRQYKLIKKGVLMDLSLFDNHEGHHFFAEYEEPFTDLEGNRFVKKLPNGDQGTSYSLPSDAGGSNRLTFAEYGLLYLFSADENFKPLAVSSIVMRGGGAKPLMSADIYKAIDTPPLPEFVLLCRDEGTNGQTDQIVFKADGVVIPDQAKSEDNKQQQLEWFAFNDKTILLQAWWTPHCKPAVYLYPPEKMMVNVKVYPAGTLIYTDPQYDSKTGWTVDAYPDGKIATNYNLKPTTYPYLYFESKVRDEVIKKPTKGWVIESESSVVSQASPEWFTPLQNHFKVLLPQLGLNTEQTKDFIDYWKKALPNSPYYFVGIIEQSNVDQIERLEITPRPDSINRVRIYFERLDQPKQVTAPLLPTTTYQLQPNKFNVVEWGGMVKNDPNHPFTCSQ